MGYIRIIDSSMEHAIDENIKCAPATTPVNDADAAADDDDDDEKEGIQLIS